MTSPLQSVRASSTSKGRPRRHFAECRTSGGRRRPTKSKPMLPQRTKKIFFSAIKEVYSPTTPRTTPLLSADGSTLLKEKSSITARWREHFSALLNRPSTVDPTVLDQGMKFRRRSNRPARENPLGWMGFLQRSSSQQVQ